MRSQSILEFLHQGIVRIENIGVDHLVCHGVYTPRPFPVHFAKLDSCILRRYLASVE
jgi:kynurenine formamidase